jgi:hypothetical protein
MGMPTPSIANDCSLHSSARCQLQVQFELLKPVSGRPHLQPSSVADVGSWSWNRVGTRNPNRGNIDYRLMCYGNGHSSGHGNVFVTGLPGPATKWTPNDVFEVRVTDNTVSYLKNGLVFHTIAQVPGGGLPKGHCPTCATPTFPMHADFILASVGDGFTDVNMLSCK